MSADDDGPTGFGILLNPALNKATAFTVKERDRYKLHGLLPPAIRDQKTQVDRVLQSVRRKSDDIERFIFLQALLARNERLFYRLVLEHIDEIMPIIYTPTVGEACKEFAHIFRQPRGLFITAEDHGNVRRILDNWPSREVKIIVVTDGERILGLGDLGANGMGIPVGKLSLYTALAGIHPNETLPIMLDVGTNNVQLRNDPLYVGVNSDRVIGDSYFDLVQELVDAVQDAYPQALIQFEDFATPNAYELLNRHRDKVLCFNDDIQGTAAVALAGIYASTRISGIKFEDLKVMFLGAGSAATGIGDLIVEALETMGLSNQAARERLWFVNSKGLVVKSRVDELPTHTLSYAHDHEPMDFLSAITSIKPHILIGATGSPGTFTEEVIRTMAEINTCPTIFALSNPTSQAECTAEQAYKWSDGRAIFASGSPFSPVEVNGKLMRPGQGNNAYIFPGIGLGAIASGASVITEDMFLIAAKTLADTVRKEDLEYGTLYPPLSQIRDVSLSIATKVAEKAYDEGIARMERPPDIRGMIQKRMYQPYY